MASIPIRIKDQYEAVAASQTDQVCGTTGGVGDVLKKLIIIPTTTSPGEVLIQDGDATAISVFKGGASSVADLKTIVIDINAKSVVGAWSITTGTNVTAIAVGDFTL